MNRIRPKPRSRIPPSAACASRNGARRLIASVRSNSLASTSLRTRPRSPCRGWRRRCQRGRARPPHRRSAEPAPRDQPCPRRTPAPRLRLSRSRQRRAPPRPDRTHTRRPRRCPRRRAGGRSQRRCRRCLRSRARPSRSAQSTTLTPAARSSSTARSPSPGSTSTARVASLCTITSKPARLASRAVALTQ